MAGKWLPRLLYALSVLILFPGVIALAVSLRAPAGAGGIAGAGAAVIVAWTLGAFLTLMVVGVALEALLDIREAASETHLGVLELRATVLRALRDGATSAGVAPSPKGAGE